MSELDTYFQPTGRRAGEAGSLQPGTMSLMDRRQAVTGMQNDQRRRLELARRVQRQLGRASRKGDVQAGMLALDFMDREAAAGQPIPAGISSFEGNRARGAQTIMDNEDQIAQMDEVTRGGSNEPLIKNPFVGTDLEEPFNRLWDKPGTRYWDDPTEQAVQYNRPGPSGMSMSPDGSISRTADGRTTTVMPDGRRAVTTASGEYSQQESASGPGSLAQRVASAPVGAPRPSPLPAGQMDRSGSRFRAGVAGSGEGGMLSASDRELLDAGRRVSGLRPAGFGSRPGGQFGIQVSSVASPAPATPTPSPVAPAPAAPTESVKIDESTLPKGTLAKVAAMRDRNAQSKAERDFAQSVANTEYETGMGRLASERANLDRETTERNKERGLEDLAWQAERNAIDERTLADQQEQARKVEENYKNRQTKRSDVETAPGSIFIGNNYRPRYWTQEDEDASARDMRLATLLSPLSMLGFGKFAVNRATRATGRAVDPSKWTR